MIIKSYKDLEIWQLSQKLIVKVYKLLDGFPQDERFGLVGQTKDSVVSVAANIAEAFGRFYFKDKIKFIYNSRGSLLKTESHLLTGKNLGFITNENLKPYEDILLDIQNLGVKINNYINSLWKASEATELQRNKQ